MSSDDELWCTRIRTWQLTVANHQSYFRTQCDLASCFRLGPPEIVREISVWRDADEPYPCKGTLGAFDRDASADGWNLHDGGLGGTIEGWGPRRVRRSGVDLRPRRTRSQQADKQPSTQMTPHPEAGSCPHVHRTESCVYRFRAEWNQRSQFMQPASQLIGGSLLETE